MRIIRRTLPMLAAAAIAVTTACKDTTAPKATTITAVAGFTTSGVAGSTVAIPPSVKILDGSGKGFPGTTVTFAVTAGDGSFSTLLPTVVTDAEGVAAVTSFTLGRTAGANTLTATATGLTGSPLNFTVTGVAGPPAAMNPYAGNAQTGTVGAPVATAPAVKVTDINANPVAGVSVTFTAGLGGGTVTGPTSTTNASGVATVGSWIMGTTAGTNILTATTQNLQPVQFGITAAAGAAAQLGIATQPPSIAFNAVVLSPQPVVQIQDQYGNLVATATTPVTAAIASGTGTLTGVTTVNAVAGVATFTNLAVGGFTGTGNIAFGFSAAGITPVTSAIVATAPAANLTIDNLYITQSTQTYARGVPLIAARGGLVRVFVKASGSNTFAPAVRVRVYAAGNTTTPVQTYTITAPVASVPTTIDETVFTSSWNVAIPANLMTVGMSVLADVDPTASLPEPPIDNMYPTNGTPLLLDVRTAPVYKITLVPVTQPGIVQGDITDANVSTLMDFAMRVYPIASYDAVVHAPYANSVQVSSGYDVTWSNLLAAILAMRAAEAPTRSFYGMIHWSCPPQTSCGTGLGYTSQGAAIGVDLSATQAPSTNWRSATAAHEWGHNFSRQHVNCGDPAGPDLAYPYNPTTIGVTGYDIVLNQVRSATGFVDLMSYCSPLWISDYTYKAVLNFRATAGNGPTVGTAPTHGLLVWGRIGPSGVVLEPSFEVDAPPSLPTQPGPYTVSGTDDAGNSIFNLSFQGAEVDHLPGERAFAFVVPMSATGRKPTMIRLAAIGRESIHRSAPAPTASALFASPFASVKATTSATRRSKLEWDATRYPMAMVRDPATGQILSFARNGTIDVAALGQSLDITLSDGVSSVRQVVAIAPR